MGDSDTQITIDGETYELADWSVEDGLRWLYRLAAILAPLAGSAEQSLPELLGTAFGKLTEAQFLEFVNLCIKQTRIAGRDENGRPTLAPLSAEASVTLRRKYHVIVTLAIAHGRRQYADFFGQLPVMLRQAGLSPAKAS